MKQIDEITYKNWKVLILKSRYKNVTELKNAWDSRSDMRKIPSVLIYRWTKNDKIDYDVNPKGNIDVINSDEIWDKIYELVKNHLVKQKKYEMRFEVSWYFKISTEKSEKIAEEIYDFLNNLIIKK